jgi:hypothetical protein
MMWSLTYNAKHACRRWVIPQLHLLSRLRWLLDASLSSEDALDVLDEKWRPLLPVVFHDSRPCHPSVIQGRSYISEDGLPASSCTSQQSFDSRPPPSIYSHAIDEEIELPGPENSHTSRKPRAETSAPAYPLSLITPRTALAV